MRIAWFLVVVAALLGAAVGCSNSDKFAMPVVVGKYWMEAERDLRALGWRGVLIKGEDVAVGPAERNRIVSQEPVAGTEHPKDVEITLRFGR